MKIFIKLILILYAISLLTSSCKKNKILPIPEQIIGEWFWEESYNSMSGITITNTGENRNEVYVFNKNGNFEQYINNRSEFSSTYEVLILESYPEQYQLKIEGRGQAGLIIENHKMELNYSYIDGDIMSFKKILDE